MTFLERDLLEQINQLREERDEWKAAAQRWQDDELRWKGIVEKQHLSTVKYKDRVEKEIEQLKADKAALLECVTTLQYHIGGRGPEIPRSRKLALMAECLKQIGGPQ